MKRLLIAALSGFLLALSSGAYAQAGPALGDRVQAAKSKADHEAIATQFEKEAKAAQAKSDDHRKLGARYRTGTGYGNQKDIMANHCDYIADKYKGIAADSSAMAKMHREFAAQAK